MGDETLPQKCHSNPTKKEYAIIDNLKNQDMFGLIIQQGKPEVVFSEGVYNYDHELPEYENGELTRVSIEKAGLNPLNYMLAKTNLKQ